MKKLITLTLLIIAQISYGQMSYKYYYNIGNSKFKLKDYNGAISNFTKAIELNPEYTNAYYNRALAKDRLNNHYGAISDYSKAIELDPKEDVYCDRGVSKSKLKDYNSAISDYSKAIELNPVYVLAYHNRGIAKYLLGDRNGGCNDWRKASNLGDKTAKKWVNARRTYFEKALCIHFGFSKAQ